MREQSEDRKASRLMLAENTNVIQAAKVTRAGQTDPTCRVTLRRYATASEVSEEQVSSTGSRSSRGGRRRGAVSGSSRMSSWPEPGVDAAGGVARASRMSAYASLRRAGL